MDEEDRQDDAASEQDASAQDAPKPKPKPKPGFSRKIQMILLIEGIILALLIGVLLLLQVLGSRTYGPHPGWLSCAANMKSVVSGIAIYSAENKGLTPADYESMVTSELLEYGYLRCPSRPYEDDSEPTYDKDRKYLKDVDYIYTLRSMNIEQFPPDMLMLYEVPDNHCNILQVDNHYAETQWDGDVIRRKIQECNDFLAKKRGMQK